MNHHLDLGLAVRIINKIQDVQALMMRRKTTKIMFNEDSLVSVRDNGDLQSDPRQVRSRNLSSSCLSKITKPGTSWEIFKAKKSLSTLTRIDKKDSTVT